MPFSSDERCEDERDGDADRQIDRRPDFESYHDFVSKYKCSAVANRLQARPLIRAEHLSLRRNDNFMTTDSIGRAMPGSR